MAEGDNYCTVADLKVQTAEGWHETYEAHGRVIQVDLSVELPDVQQIPLIQATQYTLPFSKTVTDTYTKVAHEQPGLFDGHPA